MLFPTPQVILHDFLVVWGKFLLYLRWHTENDSFIQIDLLEEVATLLIFARTALYKTVL